MILKPIIDINLFTQKSEDIVGVFGSKKWLAIYGNKLKLIGIYKDEHQLIGGFYFFKIKRYGLTFVKLPPYTPHCGLFFVSESKNKSSTNNFSKEVINAICSFFTSQKSALSILAFPYQITDFQPFIWDNYKVIPNYTYQINLTDTIENIKSNFDTKNRNVINKAIKEGVSVNENSISNEKLFDFFNTSLKSAGANVYEDELKNIFFNFSDKSNSFALIAEKADIFCGAVFCIYDKKTCYYLFGGVSKNIEISGINNLLILKSIEKAKELGCVTFDFEGSMLKGVERFFRSFGPQLTPYYTVNKAHFLIELMLKFYKRNIF